VDGESRHSIERLAPSPKTHSDGIDNIVKGELGDERIEFEEER
jgi:hypothetical protein